MVSAMLVLAALAAGAASAAAKVPRSYAECASLVAADPERALAAADAWLAASGGGMAERCRAGALVALSRPADAAVIYERLAAGAAARPPAEADFYALAATAWRLAGEAEAALGAIDRAIAIYPADAALRIDRAEANAALGRFADAIEDLSRALDLDSGNVDALTLRASAWRQTSALREAEADLDRALTLSPGHGEALLERGNVKRARGDIAGARADWQAAANQSGTAAAAVARDNLARLDAEGGR
ncbi:MAG: tetratricopeptide repeat protein [Rhodospirillales bacterium]|jgi:tetratricopeptide (TPR) repeat protein|nr:tetratricopeptide repeat protein [Rhodospirillales bacterium]